MNISELHIKGFGKWRNVTFDFAPGLNLFTAANEAGKTTLMQAIIASLYGLKRDYVRVTRYLNEYEKYLPWDQGPYETIVQYQLAGQSYRLHRTLNKDREQAKLFLDPELVEITQQYQEDKRKEFNFIERHIGLNRSLFTDITWVQADTLLAAEYLMPSLSETTDTSDPLINKLLTKMEQELAQIGKKETGENTLLGQSTKRVTLARSALTAAEHAWQSTQHLTQSIAQWQVELDGLQKRQRQINARRIEMQQREVDWQRRWQLSFQLQEADQLQEWEQKATTEQERQLHQQANIELELLKSRQSASKSVDFAADFQTPGSGSMQLHIGKLQESFQQGFRLRKEMESKREQMYKLVSSAGARKEPASGPRQKGAAPVLAAAISVALLLSGISYYLNQPLIMIIASLAVAGGLLVWRSSRNTMKKRPAEPEWQRKLRQLEAEIKELEIELRTMLGEWNVSSWDDFVTLREMHLAKVHRREAEQLTAELGEQQEKERIINKWADEIRRMLQEEKLGREDSLAELAREQQVVEEAIVTLREQIARASGEIGQNDSVSWAEAKSKYDETVATAEQLLLKREALQLARETLVSALKKWQREISPDINDLASSIMQEISAGAYQDVRLDPSQKFAVRVIEPNYQKVVEHERFSSGTQDQLYFAQRVALLQHVGGKTEPLPLFLDDHFIHYDDHRLRSTLEYVQKLAEGQQVFLFSCQSREQLMLETNLKGDARHRIHRLT